MNLETFQKLGIAVYQSGKSVYLRSRPGRGKTTVIEELPAIIGQALGKNIGIVTVSGPNLTPGDTIGFGVPKHSEHNGHPVSEMVFTLPFFWRTLEGKMLDEYDGGIIFVDEADKMDVDIKKVMGEMALSGRCGSHRLPEGWVVWMAGNRKEDRSGSTKELDHLINRRCEIDITDDLAGWERWALRAGVNPSIIAFAVSNPQIVFDDKLPEVQGPFCTPRSIVACGEMLGYLEGNSKGMNTSPEAVELATGFIGAAAAAQLFATLRLEAELPDIATILSSPANAKLPGKPDAQMLVCYKLAAITDDKNIAPIVQYIERLPADFAATYAKAAIARVPMLVASPAIMAWSKRNAALLAIVGMLK